VHNQWYDIFDNIISDSYLVAAYCTPLSVNNYSRITLPTLKPTSSKTKPYIDKKY